MPNPKPKDRATEFFDYLSTKAKSKFFIGVFLLFAATTMIYDLVAPAGKSWWLIATWCTYSGLVAVGWAYAFTRKMWVLWIVIPLSFFLPFFFGRSFYTRESMSLLLLIEAALTIFLIGWGYAMFVNFISDEGANTLRMRTEIGLAEEIHSNLVPAVNNRNGRLELYGISAPTTEVGGDLMDVVESDHKTDLYVADVTGHGVGAGVMMGMIKSAIRMKLQNFDSLDALVNDLNQVIFQVQKPGMFATFACIQFDDSSTAQYALAGHNAILHFKAATRTLDRLPNEAPPLGVVPHHTYRSETVMVSKGDTLVILTDGLTEVFDESGEEFGEERIERILVGNADKPLSEIYTAIMTAVHAHGPQMDDQTLLLARVV